MAQVRLKLGVTQQVLAEMLGVDRKYVSMIETGVKPLSNKLALKLDRISEVDIQKREQSWTKDPDGVIKNLYVKETGKLSDQNDQKLCVKPCENCARLECEIGFLRASLTEALSRIPKPKDS